MTRTSYAEHDRSVWEEIFARMPEAWYDAPPSDAMTRCQAYFSRHPVRRLLDVGCGFGRWAAVLAPDHVAAAVGIDYATTGLRAALRYTRNGLPLRFAAGSATTLPIAGGTHDGVLAALLLDNLSRDDAVVAIGEINRVTIRGAYGFFVFNPRDPSGRESAASNPTASCMHVSYTDDELDQLLVDWRLDVRDVSAEGFRVRAGIRS